MTVKNQESTPLKHDSLEELRSVCPLDNTSRRQINSYSCAKCIPHIQILYDKGKLLMTESDYETAYVCLRRAMDICLIVNNKRDNDSFRKTEEGRLYYSLSKDVLDKLGKLHNILEGMYKKKKESLESVVTAKTPENAENDSSSAFETEGFYIKPQQLVSLVENNEATVLIIDYRKEKNKLIDYRSKQHENAISVVQLDPDVIKPGCILNMIAPLADISDRPLLQQIQTFDLVVLLGDTQEVKKFSSLPKTCCTWILYLALTQYNYKNRLKREPLILEDGFEQWNFAYPSYTKGTLREVELPFADRFGSMLSAALKASELDVTYPDLFRSNPTSFDISKSLTEKFSSISTSSSTSSSTVTYRSMQNFAYNLPPSASMDRSLSESFFSAQPFDRQPLPQLTSLNLPSQTSMTTIVEQPNVNDIHHQVLSAPAVDRSKKPTNLLVKERQQPQQDEVRNENNSVNAVTSPSLNGGNKWSNGSSTLAAGNYSSEIAAINSRESSGCHLDDGVRPPTPDRSKKAAILQQDIEMFMRVYEATLANILENSTHGKVVNGRTGLYNLRNSCFMNATLQVLFHTPGFAFLFMNKTIAKYINVHSKFGSRGVISGCFSALMDSIWSGNFVAIRPRMFLEVFSNYVNKSLGDGRQHDAQEFQIYLLDALHEDSNRVSIRQSFEQNYKGVNLRKDAEDYIGRAKHFSSSIINDFFNIRTVSRVNCMTCNESSVTFEEMNQISVELPSINETKYVSLNDCLQHHFADLILEGQSRWKCPKCRALKTAGRSVRIWTLPPTLIVHMKRFSCDGGGEFVKNEMDVGFDIDCLDLSAYVHESAPRLKTKYTLYGVTNHEGRLNSGHYTAFVKSLQDHEWLNFDDESCSRINANSIKTKKAFILYYTNED